jgi:aspartate kinase
MSLLASSADDLTVIAAKLRGMAKMKWEDRKALVSLVGENIRRQPEIASRAFASVADIEVRVACHGASDRTISFLVEESRVEEAVQRLHRIFFPQPDPARDWGGISSAFCEAGTRRPPGSNDDSVAQLGRL